VCVAAGGTDVGCAVGACGVCVAWCVGAGVGVHFGSVLVEAARITQSGCGVRVTCRVGAGVGVHFGSVLVKAARITQSGCGVRVTCRVGAGVGVHFGGVFTVRRLTSTHGTTVLVGVLVCVAYGRGVAVSVFVAVG
jgi:hypothetical protein